MKHHAEHLSIAGRALLDRRQFLSNSANALGSIALANLLGLDGLLGAEHLGPIIDPARPFAPRQPHFPATAKNVVVPARSVSSKPGTTSPS
jgi:hypothetical protein